MRRIGGVLSLAFLMAVAFARGAGAPGEEGRTPYERSVVGLKVTYQTWDEDRPWLKKKPENRHASAVLIGRQRVLTTAQMLDNATFLQIETFGRARQVQPRIERIDRSINLALLSIDESSSSGLQPATLAERSPASGTLRTARWRGQKLESAASRVISLEVEQSAVGHVNHAFLRMRTDMAKGGWADPVFIDGALVGITVSQSEDESRAIPVEIIRAFLDRDATKEISDSFTTFGANWQVNQDPGVSSFLGQKGEPAGILVRQVPWGSTACGALKPRDILLELDGQSIDAEGYYLHPWLGRLGFNHILAESFRPGDAVSARVLRDGGEHHLTLTARPYPAALNLIPHFQHSAPPYVIAGGLVIRELDVPYLRTWGKEWTKDAPDSLMSRYIYGGAGQTSEQRRTVFISSVLPSGYNIGYHDLRDAIIERINGRHIGRIEDVPAALGDTKGDYHVFELSPDSPRDQVVLDASTFEAATDEIIKSYAVPATLRLREAPLPDGGGECPNEY